MPKNQIKNSMWDEEYIYCVDPNADEPIMMLLSGVGEFEYVNGAQFAKELLNLDSLGKNSIRIIINSCGGVVFDGMSIYTAIHQIKTPVDTYCGGVALSIAAVIFLAGRNRIMADYGTLMFHDPYNTDGSEDKGLEKIRLALIKMIAKDNFDAKEIEEIMHAETWMDAEEALKYGFATDIEKTIEKNKISMISQDKVAAKYNFGNLIMNKFVESIKNKNTTDMKSNILTVDELDKRMATKTINKVKAADSRTIKEYEEEEGSDDGDVEVEDKFPEETITKVDKFPEETITKVDKFPEETITKVDSFSEDDEDEEDEEDEDDDTEFKSECKNEEDEMMTVDKDKMIEDLKNQMKTMSDELKSLKDAKAKSEKETMDKRITAALKEFIRGGKIKDEKETVNLWRGQLEKDFDLASKLINSFSANKVSAKFEIKNQGTAKAATKNSIEERMIEIREKTYGKKK